MRGKSKEASQRELVVQHGIAVDALLTIERGVLSFMNGAQCSQIAHEALKKLIPNHQDDASNLGFTISDVRFLRDGMHKRLCQMENEMWSRLNSGFSGTFKDFEAYNKMNDAGRRRYCLTNDCEYKSLYIKKVALDLLERTLFGVAGRTES